jgi:hypothetical protein
MAAERMRRNLDELEQAFVEEVSKERRRRRSLMVTAEQRANLREVQRRHKHGSLRFMALMATLILTAVVVTIVMFRVLYLLLA